MRRRFFATKPAQQIPGRRLELEGILPPAAPELVLPECDCPDPGPAGGCDVTAVVWAPPVRLYDGGDYTEFRVAYVEQLDETADPTRIQTFVESYSEAVPPQVTAYAIGPATAGVRWEHAIASEPWPGSDEPLRADDWDYFTVDAYGSVAVVTQLISPSPYDNWHADITLRKL